MHLPTDMTVWAGTADSDGHGANDRDTERRRHHDAADPRAGSSEAASGAITHKPRPSTCVSSGCVRCAVDLTKAGSQEMEAEIRGLKEAVARDDKRLVPLREEARGTINSWVDGLEEGNQTV